jgi:ribosomal protein S27E
MTEPLAFRTMLGRSLRLRCPSCGGDRIFTGLLGVKERCAACGFVCRPEGGYYIGAIYINYGVTTVLALGIGGAVAFVYGMSTGMIVAAVVAVACAVGFFQFSRSLWLGVDTWATRHQGVK